MNEIDRIHQVLVEFIDANRLDRIDGMTDVDCVEQMDTDISKMNQICKIDEWDVSNRLGRTHTDRLDR